MLCNHSKATSFRTYRTYGKCHIPLTFGPAPCCRCPPPFWHAQPNPRAVLTVVRISFKSTPGPFLVTLLLWSIHYRTSDCSKTSSD